jgi:16S rRNA (adenine1518-N6/adenine1519-N6)-dimethyltransferase
MVYPRAKKHFGQNWLVDETVVKKIINAAEIQAGETVLEVGPGTGVLTQALVDAGARVVAIEADSTLIPALRERFDDSITLIEGDVLSTVYGLPSTPYKLIANIPYNITSDLLRRFLTQDPRPTRMVIMVQREVAERITAVPPDMSLLSVVCQLYTQCRRVTNVPAGAFRPIPKVDSAIVRLDSKHIRPDRALCEGEDGPYPEQVIAIAKLGFASRRKQLHGNLKSLPGVDAQGIKDALSQLDLPPSARAQELSVDNWIELTHILKKNA